MDLSHRLIFAHPSQHIKTYQLLSILLLACDFFVDDVVVALKIKLNKVSTLFWQIWWIGLTWASCITAVLQPALRSKTSNARLLPAVSTISVQFSVLKLNLSKGTKAYRQIKIQTNKYIYINSVVFIALCATPKILQH